MFAELIEEIRTEARSERSVANRARKRTNRMVGTFRSHPDPHLSKVSRADAAKMVTKTDAPKNKLAPQFVHTMRKDVSPDKRPVQSPARKAKYQDRVRYDWQKK